MSEIPNENNNKNYNKFCLSFRKNYKSRNNENYFNFITPKNKKLKSKILLDSNENNFHSTEKIIQKQFRIFSLQIVI